MDKEILRVENFTKIFNDVIANDDINFQVFQGEIHCLLGENGAGKSTLAECLYGFLQLDSGRCWFKGKIYAPRSPKDAIQVGIGMVHQHFVLAKTLSVIENIIVGTDFEGIWTNIDSARLKIQNLCHIYGIELELDAIVGQLSVGKQQWIEILKALYVGVDLLILDEPTASLTPQEVDSLFNILSKMKDEGLSIILITHKFREIFKISDRVTVLRKGLAIGTVKTKNVTQNTLVKMMIGHQLNPQITKAQLSHDTALLQIKNIHVRKDNGLPGIEGFSLEIFENEIVGIAGVAGNGQNELFDTIVGIRKVEHGQITLCGEEIHNLRPANIIQKGLASIPPNRITQGLIMGFQIKENLILGRHQSLPFCQNIHLQNEAIDHFAAQAIDDYKVDARSGEQITRTLSGGNLQKIILARELSHEPRFVIASSPTRGLDIAATEFVHKRFVELRNAGIGILLISEDLDEILKISDRIAVIFDGKLMGIVNSEKAARESIGMLMTGIREDVA